MNKIKFSSYIGLLIIILALFYSSTCKAETNLPIETGYTDGGIYYEVYLTKTLSASALLAGTGKYVSVEIKYHGVITPPLTYFYVEPVTNYSGTLNRGYYIQNSTSTSAVYRGYIYPPQ